TLFKKVGKAVLNRHKKSETYKQVSDCLSSEGSVNRSLSDLRCAVAGVFVFSQQGQFPPPTLAGLPAVDFLITCRKFSHRHICDAARVA
ncbi:hypothetical protein ACRTDL_18715, partial [Shewanella algae]|uniref:hypothetical protein n=1 Tax=Shewanella algae TaxID=38313 RepID=UPI003D7D98B1